MQVTKVSVFDDAVMESERINQICTTLYSLGSGRVSGGTYYQPKVSQNINKLCRTW